MERSSLTVSDNTIGVVTITYNSGTVIEEFLESLWAQSDPDFRLYVVDNVSTDDTLPRIAQHDDPRIVLIRNTENVGVAAGNNQGIRAALDAGCGSVLLLNNDTTFEPELFAKLRTGLDAHQCDMVVPKMMHHDDPQRIWCSGGTINRWRACAGQHYGLLELDQGQYDRPRRIEYAPTCCMLIKSDVFDRIGMMDEKYFAYFDDTDFCFRAFRTGIPMFYLPNAVLWHKVSSLTGGAESLFSIRLSARNKVYFIRKNICAGTRAFWLSLYAASLLGRWLGGKDSWTTFRLRRESFVKGLAL